MKEAPLFIRAYDLHSWLLDRFDRSGESGEESAAVQAGFPELTRSVLHHSRELLNAVSLAVARFESGLRLVEADEQATLLRVHLRLASEKEMLDDRQLVYATGELTNIGRQIGGWRRHFEAVE